MRLLGKMLVTISVPPLKNEYQGCFNSSCGGPVSCTATNCIPLYLNWVFNCQSFQYVFVYNFINIHAMSHRFQICLTHSSTVNIKEPAFYFTIGSHCTVSWVKLRSFAISTPMSESKSLNTMLLQVIRTSKNECVMMCNLSDLTFQIISDAW